MKQNETVEFGIWEKILQFYFLNRNKVHAYIGGAFLIAVFCITYLTSGPSDTEINGAKERFAAWKGSPSNQKLEEEMLAALRKIPGLEQGLQAEIAQTLLKEGKIDAAEPIANQCINRLKKESPVHAAFATNSLLIEKGLFQKALEGSVALKELLEKGDENGSSLYASNLVRIAFLQAQVGNCPGELSAWEEVRGLLDMGESSSGAEFLRKNFKEKAFSLNDYISQREKILILAH